MSDAKHTGLYGKFRVQRTDGRDAPGEKHDGCSYFVLDLTHDEHARAAALAYAESCECDGWGRLARDLRQRVAEIEAGEVLERYHDRKDPPR